MGTMDYEDLLDYFLTEYRQNLLHLQRKLRHAEEDSLSPFICLQEKKKEAKLMRKALEAKKEVRKPGGRWGTAGRVCWRAAEGSRRQGLAVGASSQVTLALRCQGFKERMEAVACRWRDLHAREAELKTHKEESLRIVKEDDKMQVQALKKAIENRENKVQKESELLRAKRELEVLSNNHEKLCNKAQKCSLFKKYLEDVVKISQIQQLIQDLADIFMEGKEDIQNRQQAAIPTAHGNVRGSARVGRAGQRAPERL
ncbi:coiled-coil domain-containing protein 42 isoform 2-T2 [Ara ararauna]